MKAKNEKSNITVIIICLTDQEIPMGKKDLITSQ